MSYIRPCHFCMTFDFWKNAAYVIRVGYGFKATTLTVGIW